MYGPKVYKYAHGAIFERVSNTHYVFSVQYKGTQDNTRTMADEVADFTGVAVATGKVELYHLNNTVAYDRDYDSSEPGKWTYSKHELWKANFEADVNGVKVEWSVLWFHTPMEALERLLSSDPRSFLDLEHDDLGDLPEFDPADPPLPQIAYLKEGQ